MENSANQTNQSSVIILICVLIITSVAYFLINPTLAKIKDSNIKLSAKTNEINEMKTKISSLQTLATDFTSATDQVKKLGLALPTDSDTANVLVQLETMAISSGLQMNSIQPSTQAKKGVVNMTVSLQGEYTSLVNFITAMEKNLRPIDIKTINIASAKKENNVTTNFSLGLELLSSGTSGVSK